MNFSIGDIVFYNRLQRNYPEKIMVIEQIKDDENVLCTWKVNILPDHSIADEEIDYRQGIFNIKNLSHVKPDDPGLEEKKNQHLLK